MTILRTMEAPVFKDNLTVSGGSLFAFGLAYLFQVFAARMLGPESYGELSVLLAVFSAVSIPLSAAGVALTIKAAQMAHSGETDDLQHLFVVSIRWFVQIGVLIAIIILFATPILQALLGISSWSSVSLLAVSVILSSVLPSPRSILRGLQRFGRLALVEVLHRILLLATGIAALVYGYAINGAVLSFGLSAALATVIATLLLPADKRRRRTSDALVTESLSLRTLLMETAPPLALLSCTSLFGNMVMMIAKVVLAPVEAGIFAVIFGIGNLLLLLSVVIGSVLASKAAYHRSSYVDVARRTLLFMVLLSSAGCIGALLFGSQVVLLLFGPAYPVSSGELFLFVLAMSFFSLGNVMLFLFAANSDMRVVVPLIAGLVIEFLLLVSIGIGIDGIVAASLLSGIIFLIVCSISLLLSSRGWNSKAA